MECLVDFFFAFIDMVCLGMMCCGLHDSIQNFFRCACWFLQGLFHSLLIVSCIFVYKLDSPTRNHEVYVYFVLEGSFKRASLVRPGWLFKLLRQ